MSGKLVAAEAGSGKGREWKGMMQTTRGGWGLTTRGCQIFSTLKKWAKY